jgi:hypothetical protein
MLNESVDLFSQICSSVQNDISIVCIPWLARQCSIELSSA